MACVFDLVDRLKSFARLYKALPLLLQLQLRRHCTCGRATLVVGFANRCRRRRRFRMTSAATRENYNSRDICQRQRRHCFLGWTAIELTWLSVHSSITRKL